MVREDLSTRCKGLRMRSLPTEPLTLTVLAQAYPSSSAHPQTCRLESLLNY